MARLATDALDAAMLGSILNRVRAQAAADPFSNPILLFALELTLRIDRGEIELDGLESLVQRLTAEAFADRAERLAKYLGETAIAANERAITGSDREEGAHGQLRGVSRGACRAACSAWSSPPIRRFRLRWSWRVAWPNWRPGRPSRESALDQAGRDERMEAAAARRASAAGGTVARSRACMGDRGAPSCA